MSKVYAHRDLKICSKDCLCLFVCPTGATNNETGQIDASKCIGCGACAAACPAKAITLIPRKMPPQQKKTEEVIEALNKIVQNKILQLWQLNDLLQKSTSLEERKLWKALKHSNMVVLEDIMREKGYMLQKKKNTHDFLESLKSEKDIDQKVVEQLLQSLEVNE